MKRGAENPEKPKHLEKINPKVFAVILVAALFVLMYGGIATILYSPQAPKTLATNQTLAIDENMLFSYEINRYPARVEISNVSGQNITMGFALDPESINFGIIPRGGNLGKRFITLENVAEGPSKIMLTAYGNISPMVKFSENNFLLQKDAPKPIEIILETKNDTALGNYSGEIDIIVKKPKNIIAAKLL
ncbi:MAG: hypothetical protein ABIF85_03215 [Nanoarchaeota archaeon]|nr:hypothetical protein [Nanoarchaeota archaeon]MBU4451597.1 hypothetical protein [Nanoarchaeota archaeon]MCG2723119.1 hypothetical protein [archaeon]